MKSYPFGLDGNWQTIRLNQGVIFEEGLRKNIQLPDNTLSLKKNNVYYSWSRAKSFTDLLFDGSSFGSERGQIRKITDHNHIIPFYAYGVGTYDFDMKKIKPMEYLAQDKAQKAIEDYFKK